MEIILYSETHKAEDLKKFFEEKVSSQGITIKYKESAGTRSLDTVMAFVADNADWLVPALIDAAFQIWDRVTKSKIVLTDKDGNRYELPAKATPEQIAALKNEVKGKEVIQLGFKKILEKP